MTKNKAMSAWVCPGCLTPYKGTKEGQKLAERCAKEHLENSKGARLVEVLYTQDRDPHSFPAYNEFPQKVIVSFPRPRWDGSPGKVLVTYTLDRKDINTDDLMVTGQ